MSNTIVAGAMRWGSWGAGFSTTDYERMIGGCIDAGIIHFDHADIYGDHTTEAGFGAALAGMNLARDSYRLITKAGIVMKDAPANRSGVKHYSYEPAYLLGQLEQSLQNLRTDCVDLWLLHRPSPLMNLEQAAGVLAKAVDSGKAKAVGVSNFSRAEVEILAGYIPLAAHQFECSLFQPAALDAGLFHQCQQLSMMPQIWSPLGGQPAEMILHYPALLPVLEEIRDLYGYDPADALLAFVCALPFNKQIVAGTTSTERLRRMKEVASAGPLAPQHWFALYEAVRGKEVD